jgi:hypothetical protein
VAEEARRVERTFCSILLLCSILSALKVVVSVYIRVHMTLCIINREGMSFRVIIRTSEILNASIFYLYSSQITPRKMRNRTNYHLSVVLNTSQALNRPFLHDSR